MFSATHPKPGQREIDAPGINIKKAPPLQHISGRHSQSYYTPAINKMPPHAFTTAFQRSFPPPHGLSTLASLSPPEIFIN
ncbi:hypothetical protein CEXT_171481 [Caerostris extrusa]|uniref:Uncharacterized protein n=1 Tax=Caerostris extrusa TaxID=172846 RepID=A0AAV4QW65_CAEEX|nr:hypothetical protein CEXT_171481 [Caerostris extrusa]